MQRTIHLKGVKPTFEVSIAFPVQLRIVVYDKTFHIRYHRYYYKISSMSKLRRLQTCMVLISYSIIALLAK